MEAFSLLQGVSKSDMMWYLYELENSLDFRYKKPET